MEERRIAVVIPVGPGDDVADTLDSVRAYIDPSRLVVLVDDTGDGRLGNLGGGDVVTVRAPRDAPGGQGGLWVKLAAGYREVVRRCHVDLVLRMDADALVIGAGLEDAASARFAAEPALGLLGAFRIGPDGAARDLVPAAAILRSETGVRGLRRPRLRAALRRLERQARRRGYSSGDHALGGAVIHSGAAVRTMAEQGLLDLPVLARSGLGEDHLFGLVTTAAGFAIGDFSGPGDPMAVTWRGLPAEPAELLRGPALVTHSVRAFGGVSEPQIRRTFREARATP